MMLQRFLRDWYGIDHQPTARSENKVVIDILERPQPGAGFDHAFLKTFSRHHYTPMEPVNACMSGSQLRLQPDLAQPDRRHRPDAPRAGAPLRHRGLLGDQGLAAPTRRRGAPHRAAQRRRSEIEHNSGGLDCSPRRARTPPGLSTARRRAPRCALDLATVERSRMVRACGRHGSDEPVRATWAAARLPLASSTRSARFAPIALGG